MRKIIISIMFAILLTSIVSAEIIINQQPKDLYNLGDSFSIPVTIKSTLDVSGSFQMNLLCNGYEINFYKNDVKLLYGEEVKMEPLLVLTKDKGIGNCKIKALLIGEEPQLTDEFKISELINIQITTQETEFAPGESILIEGEAIKENGDDVDGFIGLEIMSDDSSGNLNQLETINNGFFSINISFPKDMRAGQYLAKLNAYERNFMGETTNHGFTDFNILIKQVPTNLEIVFADSEVEPGTNLKVKAILHDQTGEGIESSAVITIKDEEDTILEQSEKSTGEFLEFPVAYNEPPAEWTVVAVSNKLTSEANFKIKEKQNVKIELINRTVTVTNIGNVLYNKSILIKIGNESLNIDVYLDIDESQKYVLTAPDGEYEVEIITNEGDSITGVVVLTGKTVEVKEASGKAMTLVKYSVVWIFMIIVLGFVAFTIFKKGYKRSFFGYIHSKKKEKKKTTQPGKDSIISAKSKGIFLAKKHMAELSLSIKGNKQNACVVCLKIKNLGEIESKKSNAGETLQKIVDFSEEKKSVVYENQDNLFFILAPVKTRTFKNEKTAVEIAQRIREILINHNKLAKQKIGFGISLNYGAIIAKQEKDVLKFMSMGTLITTAKKIASLSEGEIFLSEKIKDRLMSDVKTEKHTKGKISVYTIKEIKDKKEHQKFIRSFLDRIDKK